MAAFQIAKAVFFCGVLCEILKNEEFGIISLFFDTSKLSLVKESHFEDHRKSSTGEMRVVNSGQ